MKARDYKQSKIYKLVCNKTGLQYIGSTTSDLEKRLENHEKSYAKWKQGKCRYITSFKVLRGGDYKIELVKECPCWCKKELLEYKAFYTYITNCVNSVNPVTNKKRSKVRNVSNDDDINLLYRLDRLPQNSALRGAYEGTFIA